MELGVADDHTPTLKSELSYLMLESLPALGNRGFEVEETLDFCGVCVCVCVCVLTYLIKMKPEYLYSVPRSPCHLALI